MTYTIVYATENQKETKKKKPKEKKKKKLKPETKAETETETHRLHNSSAKLPNGGNLHILMLNMVQDTKFGYISRPSFGQKIVVSPLWRLYPIAAPLPHCFMAHYLVSGLFITISVVPLLKGISQHYLTIFGTSSFIYIR